MDLDNENLRQTVVMAGAVSSLLPDMSTEIGKTIVMVMSQTTLPEKRRKGVLKLLRMIRYSALPEIIRNIKKDETE